MNINKAIIVGRLTRDPEVRTTQTGQTVTNFSVATSYKWKGQNWEQNEKVEFHNVVAWGKPGEIIGQYVIKGQEIYIEGRLETRSWEDKDCGKKMYKTEIVLESFQFGAKPMNQGGMNNAPRTQNNNFSNQNNHSSTLNNSPIKDDEIPTINLEDEEEIKIEEVPF